jgi:hypothetical protein
MELQLTRDARRFAALAGAMLASRIELNVPATVLGQVMHGEYPDAAPLFACGLDEHGDVAFVALRTPPWPMLVGAITPPPPRALIGLWLEEDPELPGVTGEPDLAGPISAAWEQLTGGTVRRRMAAGMHALSEVTGPSRHWR